METEHATLLLVDDEADFRKLMARIFIRRGIDCHTADGCIAALDMLMHQPVDVIVMDISMPGMDGLRCMQEIHQLFPDLPVILLTGHASPHIGLTGMREGAFDYCLKPVDFNELLEKIKLARRSRDAVRPTKRTSPVQQ